MSKYTCSFSPCQFSAYSVRSLARHLHLEHESSSLHCTQCDHVSTTSSRLVRHQERRHGRLIVDASAGGAGAGVANLDRASSSTPTPSSLARKALRVGDFARKALRVGDHSLLAHTGVAKRSFICFENDCDYTASSISKLEKHQASCRGGGGGGGGRSFSDDASSGGVGGGGGGGAAMPLARPPPDEADEADGETDEEGRRFMCTEDGCSFSAKLRVNLKTHMKKHTGEEAYDCKEVGCDYATAYKISFNAHMLTHKVAIGVVKHVENEAAASTTKSTKHVCKEDGCSFKANHISALIIHNRVHTGERPYICDAVGCGYASSQKGNLKSHQSVQHPLTASFTGTTKKGGGGGGGGGGGAGEPTSTKRSRALYTEESSCDEDDSDYYEDSEYYVPTTVKAPPPPGPPLINASDDDETTATSPSAAPPSSSLPALSLMTAVMATVLVNSTPRNEADIDTELE